MSTLTLREELRIATMACDTLLAAYRELLANCPPEILARIENNWKDPQYWEAHPEFIPAYRREREARQ